MLQPQVGLRYRAALRLVFPVLPCSWFVTCKGCNIIANGMEPAVDVPAYIFLVLPLVSSVLSPCLLLLLPSPPVTCVHYIICRLVHLAGLSWLR
jgi:hypothetical protein